MNKILTLYFWLLFTNYLIMDKLAYLQQKKLNSTDELREILTNLEYRQTNIRSLNPPEALKLIQDLDQANGLLLELEESGAMLEPEQLRFESSQALIKHKAPMLLRSLGGATVLRENQPALTPPKDHWWWHIDEIAADRRQQRIRRTATSFAIVVAIIGGIILAFNTILAPSPEAIARVEAENEASSAIEAGDYRAAIAAIEVGLSKVPN